MRRSDFSWDFLDMSIAMFRSWIHFPISALELKAESNIPTIRINQD
uniref:Uncharacterized protein n=1 Tax=Anguilla anguilla TaxID=7936 RepID=A0A0E9UIQ7_ANGAN